MNFKKYYVMLQRLKCGERVDFVETEKAISLFFVSRVDRLRAVHIMMNINTGTLYICVHLSWVDSCILKCIDKSVSLKTYAKITRRLIRLRRIIRDLKVPRPPCLMFFDLLFRNVFYDSP